MLRLSVFDQIRILEAYQCLGSETTCTIWTMMARVKTKSLLSASKPTGNRPKTSTRSLRFELTLKETTKEEYSEFNYLDLIEEEKVYPDHEAG